MCIKLRIISDNNRFGWWSILYNWICIPSYEIRHTDVNLGEILYFSNILITSDDLDVLRRIAPRPVSDGFNNWIISIVHCWGHHENKKRFTTSSACLSHYDDPPVFPLNLPLTSIRHSGLWTYLINETFLTEVIFLYIKMLSSLTAYQI